MKSTVGVDERPPRRRRRKFLEWRRLSASKSDSGYLIRTDRGYRSVETSMWGTEGEGIYGVSEGKEGVVYVMDPG